MIFRPKIGSYVYSRRTGRRMEVMGFQKYGRIDCIIVRPAPGDPERKQNRRAAWPMDWITKDGFQQTLF